MGQFKTFTLNTKQHAALAALSKSENGQFWSSLMNGYATHGSLTQKQFKILKDELAKDKLPKLQAYDRDERVPVLNQVLRDGKPVCRHCRELATIAIGRIGVCRGDVEKELAAVATFQSRDRELTR